MSTHPLHEGRARAKAEPARRDWVGLLLSIWESENVLSIRLILATVIAVYALSMRGANCLTTEESLKYLEIVVELMGLGALKIIASRFAPKPTVDPTQQSKPDEPTT